MKVQLRYSAFTQSSLILIDGQPLPMVSHLARYQGLPFEGWCGIIAAAIAEEVNGSYSLEYTGRSCESRILGQLVRENNYCTSFSAVAPPLSDTALVRLKKLSGYVQSGLSCSRIRHTIYVYSDDFGYIAEELHIPRLAFCKIQVQVHPLGDLHQHPVSEPAYVIVRDNMEESRLLVPASRPERMLIEKITARPRGISISDGCFIEYINEPNASALLDQYFELWSYADLLIKAMKAVSIDESHPTYLQFISLDKQEPVTVVKFPSSIEYGTTEPISVRSIPSGTPSGDISYRISDESVIQLTVGGLQAVGVGECVVEAYRAGQSRKIASQTITCYRRNRITSLTVDPNRKEITVGETFSLNFSYQPTDADDASKIQIASSNGLIAVVENGLRIRGRSPGTCSIRVQSERASASCDLHVYPALQELLLTFPENELIVGETARIEVERVPAEATLEKLKYTVSPPSLGRYEPGAKSFYAENAGSGEFIVSTENGKVVAKAPVKVRPASVKVNWKPIAISVAAIIIALLLIFGGK